MKHVFACIIFIHGLIHILGFLKEYKLAPVSQLSGVTTMLLSRNASLIAGGCWLIACILFMITLISYYIGKGWWWIPAAAGTILSQLLIILYWNDAKWGTIANIIVSAGAIIAFAQWNFNLMVSSEVKRLYASVRQDDNTIITKDMLNGLPLPVQNWLLNSGIVGRPTVHTLRLRQRGLMRSKPEQKNWSSMQAEQYFTVDEPSFIWKANMAMIPMISITARDKYVQGKGEMNIKVLSLIPIANSSGYKVDQGTLQRYLAEICWFPSAALSPYINWEHIDAGSAKATLTYKGVSGSMLFHFNENGSITSCSANRYMSTGNDISLEKWEVRSTEHRIMDGIRIPVKSEATWKLKGGDFTWAKLEITEIEYNSKEMY
jgi:hypothetical protein